MLEKTSEKLVAAIAIFIVAGLASYLLYQQQQSQPMEEEPVLDLGAIPGVEMGTQSSAPDAPTLGGCAELALQEDRDLCWSLQAGEEMNVRLCDNIEVRTEIVGGIKVEKASSKVICVEAVARDLAITGEREKIDEAVAICEQEFQDNTDRRYHCLTQVARESLDEGLCEQMPLVYKDKCDKALAEEGEFFLPTV